MNKSKKRQNGQNDRENRIKTQTAEKRRDGVGEQAMEKEERGRECG